MLFREYSKHLLEASSTNQLLISLKFEKILLFLDDPNLHKFKILCFTFNIIFFYFEVWLFQTIRTS